MKIAIAGCMGRMGQTLLQYVSEVEGVTLVGGTILSDQHDDAVAFARMAGLPDDLLFSNSLEEVLTAADAIIDFTIPEYSLDIATSCVDAKCVHVCGTTGFDAEQLSQMQGAAARTQIVHAPNMSVCVNVFMKLTEQVASLLDEEFDIEIVEMHHRFKADAPSGTALGLGRAAAKGRDVVLDDVADRGRDGITGSRTPGNIGFAALRGGDVVGDHTVTFAGMGERLELTHKASSREIYARGAVKAAKWAHGKPAGYYSMMDVLGL